MECKYKLLTKEQLYNLTPARILEMYNDAIETIWLLQMRLNELRNENEQLWESYEESQTSFTDRIVQ